MNEIDAKQLNENSSFENPVTFYYGQGMTTAKLDCPIFKRAHRRITHALLIAAAATALFLPVTISVWVAGALTPTAIFGAVILWVWARAFRAANDLRDTFAVTMSEEQAEHRGLFETALAPHIATTTHDTQPNTRSTSD